MYATISQLEDRITSGQLLQRFPETGDDRQRAMTAYLEAATGIMDAYICIRYAVPAPPSPLLSHICLSLALWSIEADRGGAYASDGMPQSVQVPYDRAMSMLEKISSGEMKLSGASAPAPSGESAAGLEVVGLPPVIAADSPGMEFF